MAQYVVQYSVDLRDDLAYIEQRKRYARCEAFYRLAAEFIEPDRQYRITTQVIERLGEWVFMVRADELSSYDMLVTLREPAITPR